MGCPDLLPNNVPFWPDDEANWPTTADKKNRLTRFHFKELPTHPDNSASLDRILEFIRTHGANYHTAAAPALRLISPKDLRDRLVKKYKDLQKSLRTAGRIPKRGATEVIERGSETNGIVVLTRTQQQSRAKGVCLNLDSLSFDICTDWDPKHNRNVRFVCVNAPSYPWIAYIETRNTTTSLLHR